MNGRVNKLTESADSEERQEVSDWKQSVNDYKLPANFCKRWAQWTEQRTFKLAFSLAA